MKRLHFQKPNNLSRLHDELLSGIPELRPIPGPVVVGAPRQVGTPLPVPLQPVMAVEGLGDDIWLTVPDGADEATIASIVQAHDSAATRPPSPTEQQRQRIGDLLAIPRSDWTVAQQRELLQLVAQLIPPYEGGITGGLP